MSVFSTLQFVNDSPVSNRILKKEERISSNPAENPGRHICLPVQQVQSEDQYWLIMARGNFIDAERR